MPASVHMSLTSVSLIMQVIPDSIVFDPTGLHVAVLIEVIPLLFSIPADQLPGILRIASVLRLKPPAFFIPLPESFQCGGWYRVYLPRCTGCRFATIIAVGRAAVVVGRLCVLCLFLNCYCDCLRHGSALAVSYLIHYMISASLCGIDIVCNHLDLCCQISIFRIRSCHILLCIKAVACGQGYVLCADCRNGI